MTAPERDDEPSRLARKEKQDTLWLGLLIVAAALLAAGFLMPLKPHHPIERLPGFYAAFGFLAVVLVAFAGRALRRLIMRDEDYYERD